jgi:hypothetical protein
MVGGMYISGLQKQHVQLGARACHESRSGTGALDGVWCCVLGVMAVGSSARTESRVQEGHEAAATTSTQHTQTWRDTLSNQIEATRGAVLPQLVAARVLDYPRFSLPEMAA